MKKHLISFLCIVSALSPFFSITAVSAETTENGFAQTDRNDAPSYYNYEITASGSDPGIGNYYSDIESEVFSGSEEKVDFSINVEKAGLYNIEIIYTPLKGNYSAIERRLLINGLKPFKELENVSFERAFTNESEIKTDSLGNDIIPAQTEVFVPLTKRLNDVSGYYNMPYEFYLEKGNNTFTLVGIQGNMKISSFGVLPPENPPSYSELEKEYVSNGYKLSNKPVTLISAENADLKSSHTLVPTYDRSSPNTQPYSVSKLKLNTIGGDSWKSTGMWLEWNITVDESALYKIDFKYRQSSAKGVNVFRKLTIDGKIPFAEAKELEFPYSRSWSYSGSSKSDKLFYLEKGTHILRLEAVLGNMGDILRQSEDFLYELNALYQEIIMVTGTSPDTYRDYKISKRIPNLEQRLLTLKSNTEKIIAETEKATGGKNSVTVLLSAFAVQLKRIAKDPEKITALLSDFKNNIISLGETLSEIRNTPLELDYIALSGSNSELPKANAGVFKRIKHEIHVFILSFTESYNTFSDNGKENAEKVTVWVSSGREQANIIKNLIDSSFANENTAIELKLVQGALLQAAIAGKAPDAALNLGQSDPVNYALRGAVCDLSKFSDFNETAAQFNPGAIVPFEFNGGVYALPETESFYMMFYRKDVLERLNITPPKTWDELYGILPILSRNNMEFGLPSVINTFATLLYQQNGSFYREDQTSSTLNSQTALKVFQEWTDLYTAYRLPVSFEFANRFRTGEMPLAIMDYTVFNTITAFAPELRGYWDFCEIPGTYNAETGAVDRTTPCSVSGGVIMQSSAHKQAAWEFLKWWLSADIQSRYASKLESVLGESARYAAANIEARQNIGWSSASLKKLNSQAMYVIGIPEIAGGYFTSRHITNAFTSVINKGSDPVDTLNKYVRIINREIGSKRKELGLEK